MMLIITMTTMTTFKYLPHPISALLVLMLGFLITSSSSHSLFSFISSSSFPSSSFIFIFNLSFFSRKLFSISDSSSIFLSSPFFWMSLFSHEPSSLFTSSFRIRDNNIYPTSSSSSSHSVHLFSSSSPSFSVCRYCRTFPSFLLPLTNAARSSSSSISFLLSSSSFSPLRYDHSFLTRSMFSCKTRTYSPYFSFPFRSFSSSPSSSSSLLFSSKTDAILEQLKELTLLEASDLVAKIEKTFGVKASASTAFQGGGGGAAGTEVVEEEEEPEQTIFDVILESVETPKRIPVIKLLRILNKDLNLKEAKDVVDTVPRAVAEKVDKAKAEDIKKQLEEAGGKVSLK